MLQHGSDSRRPRVTSAAKAEIMGKHLFDGISAKELSRRYRVSPTSIGVWRNQVRHRLESFFVADSEKFKVLCRELTSLKKELGEL
jgi:transposase-like protein